MQRSIRCQGAKEFLDELRSMTQVIIISDTFTQFAAPLMKKLGWPTIFCNSLEVAEDGEITGLQDESRKFQVFNSKSTPVDWIRDDRKRRQP